MDRALIIAPQWIGDAVMSQPLIATLAERGETITVAALPWVAPVYRAMPQVAKVLELPFVRGKLEWAARRELGQSMQRRFDAAYVLPNSFKSALLPWFADIPVRIGYRGEARWGLLNRRLANPRARPPMVQFYLALARPGVARVSQSLFGETRMSAPVEHPELALVPGRIEQVCHAYNLTPGGYWAFAPGAEFGPAKCWPPEHYASLAAQLHARTSLPVVLLGSPKEGQLASDIEAKAPPGVCRPLAGKTSLDEAMALIAGARGVVSNDSGLMHVAAAFGVPQVAVFGSTSPEHTPPLNEHAAVIWLKEEHKIDCSPCFERVCPLGHTRCLQEVAPQRVETELMAKVAAAAA
ncbi:MAG: lipopolysaccharide heptosyltransferase II [Leptothrix sp. (in: b-proteobacteria)]